MSNYKTVSVFDGVATREITSNEFMIVKTTENDKSQYILQVDHDKYVVDEKEYKSIKSKLEG